MARPEEIVEEFYELGFELIDREVIDHLVGLCDDYQTSEEKIAFEYLVYLNLKKSPINQSPTIELLKKFEDEMLKILPVKKYKRSPRPMEAKLLEALSAMETKMAVKIEECHRNFFETVKETINALTQTSVSHTSNIAAIMNYEIAEFKKMCMTSNNETNSPNVIGNKYLVLRPIRELQEQNENSFIQPMVTIENSIELLSKDQYDQNKHSNVPDEQQKSLQEDTITYSDKETLTVGENSSTSMNHTLETVNEATTSSTTASTENSSCNPSRIYKMGPKGTKNVYFCKRCNYHSIRGSCACKELPRKAGRTARPKRKIYKCSKCNYKASSKYYRKKHERNVHDESMQIDMNQSKFQCQKCLAIFVSGYMMKVHLCSNEPLHSSQPLTTVTVQPFSPVNKL